MIKRAFSIILILTVLFSFAVTAAASDAAVITVSDASAKAGEAIELVVSVGSNPGISGAGITIEYSKNAMELTDIQPLVGGNFVKNLANNNFSWLQGKNVAGDFDLVKLFFKIKNTAGGTYSVRATLTGSHAANLTNQNAAAVPVSFNAGTVTVERIYNPDPDVANSHGIVLTDKAIADAEAKGESVPLPIPAVNAGKDSADAPEITIITNTENPVRVEIPVNGVTNSTVALLVMPDGSEKIVRDCVPTETGLELSVADGTVVKVINNPVRFADVHDAKHWAVEAVNFAAARELVQGVSAERFSPNTKTTRGMVFTVLARYAGADTTPAPDEHWHDPGTRWAVANGVSDGSSPDGIVTREQIVTMLWRLSGSPSSAGSYDSFSDANEVSAWAADALRWAVSTGLIQGREQNNLAPKESATRAEFAQMLSRYCLGK